ncbi:hypothetical protein CALCODRAFT_178070 [Calocera cornea HHB12733]|uniref:Pentacotripeptide-repeat region of PRORP domain-containing protein n=1 Tax=Calocera cornea HHB12733 TaxID=1353952 RepID=A0A165CEB2_9BASI|nr:hypothetical protein CALCODRAFT_178070 [Calocera cornea HHB12733]
MIPKLATHLLQLKSHGTHTLRAVLQSTTSTTTSSVTGVSSASYGLPWAGVGSSSSSWGGSTGAGGAKFNAGSRFYAGYTGPGRVLTQATSLPSADGSNSQLDDSDDRPPAAAAAVRAPPLAHLRRRRSSLSLLAPRHVPAPGPAPAGAIHSQAKHAFGLEDRPRDALEGEGEVRRARRNSTSALEREPSPSEEPILPPPAPLAEAAPDLTLQTLPAAHPTSDDIPTTARPGAALENALGAAPADEPTHDLAAPDQERYTALLAAKQSGSVRQVMQEVLRLRQSADAHSVATYNMALRAVNAVRTKGMPIAVVLELYNEMLEKELTPDHMTYSSVIRALCDRDQDIHELLTFGKLEGGAPDAAPSPEHVHLLQNEENFASAMALFNAARALRASHFGIDTYNALLRSAGFRGDMDSAVRVYAALEARPDVAPNLATYGHLIAVYAHAKDVDAAQDIFREFRAAAERGALPWPPKPRDRAARRVYMQVYNRMLSAYFQCGEPGLALALLEEMLGPGAKEDFSAGDVPAPSSSTFTEVIAGFCDTGDLDTAVTWFERLLNSQATAPKNDPYEPSALPLRPDREAWLVLSHHLTAAGRLDTLQRLLTTMIHTAPAGYTPLQASDIADFLSTNTAYLLSPAALTYPALSLQLVNGLKDILPQCATVARLSRQRIHVHEWTLVRCLVRLGEHSDALALARTIVSQELADIAAAGRSQVAQYLLHGLQRSALEAANEFMGSGPGSTGRLPNITLTKALDLFHTLNEARATPNPALHAAFVSLYIQQKADYYLQHLPVRTEWLLLRDAFLHLHQIAYGLNADQADGLEPYFTPAAPFPGIESLIDDIAPRIASWEVLGKPVLSPDLHPIYEQLRLTRGPEIALAQMDKLGPLWQDALGQLVHNAEREKAAAPSASDSDAPSTRLVSSEASVDTDPTPATSELDSAPSEPEAAPPARTKLKHRVNLKLSSLIETQRHRLDNPAKFFEMIVADAKRRLYPTPAALSLVINALGRAHQLDMARQLYGISQTILASLEDNKEEQTRAWFTIEDAMVCAHAFAGDMVTANLHRTRMIEQGGAPSCEAYAVLILTVKEFTDDCNVALALYNEAISLGVAPNVFLYNNIISKLSKARKAEAALEIFQDMKKHGVRPTSVTYGALVGACCRVGDADTAMYLFSEMAAQANFRPKAPPFNTMIQFFVHTKPDRDRALHYYNLMVASNVSPSAHTFKLLMDAYGLIEPVDMSAVELVFEQLVARRDLQVQGNHWASLITAWGCSCKDVDRAQAIFDSIPAHPTTLTSGQELPDAQTWEAFINVLVTQHRFDLLGPTLENLNRSGVHMTAYIANVVIRGYASAGEIERARAVFENMLDPPEGMAASFNHVPVYRYDSIAVASDTPVYREPSTYEAMIRAEMGVGERDRAVSLLQRMEARHFPPAVEARIRGLVTQAIAFPMVPDALDLATWQTGISAIDYAHLPVAPAVFYGPVPVDPAMYEATA